VEGRNRCRDGERARVAFALVGVSRGGRVPRWKAAPGFARDEPGQSDGFYNWHRAKQERARPGEDSRSAGCGAQQPLVWRILAAHAGRRRRDRGGARLDFEAVGPRAARNHGRGSRGPLDKRARRANDLYRTVSQHKWKNSRGSIVDFAAAQVMLRIKRVYDKPAREDDGRVLVDRLWPRGMQKEAVRIDLWIKEVAPSDALRKSFCHDVKK